jgi:hypothetical protein
MDLNYAWRSLRLNVTIYLPDELGAWAKEQGINLSAMLRAEIEAGRRSNTADQGDGSPPLIDIAKRRADRLLVLNEIYEAAGGSRQVSVGGPWLLEHMNLPQDQLEDVCTYLLSERLIEGTKTLWGVDIPYTLRLTHRGQQEMERSRSAPGKPTDHFPPMVSVVHIGGDNIGSPIQAGSPGARQAVVARDLDLGKVREILAEVEAQASSLELPADDAAQLRADMATVKAQVDSPRPNQRTIREHLLSAREILDNTAGGVAAAGIVELLQHAHL